VLGALGAVRVREFLGLLSQVLAAQILFRIFTPKIGEDESILTSIFFKWVETTN